MHAIIETPRLILRPLVRADLPELVRVLNNFNVSRWLARLPFPYTMMDAENFLALCATPETGTLQLAITLGGAVIGVISYERAPDAMSAEFGYWLAEDQWRKGYMREAASAMAAHAFTADGHDMLSAGYHAGNEGSRRILEGLGFERTGERLSGCLAEGVEKTSTRLTLPRGRWREMRGGT